MEKVRLHELEMAEAWYEEDQRSRWKVNLPFTPDFPLWTGIQTESLSVVLFTIDPEERLGEHTDSAEEALLILDGEVEVTVDNEALSLSAGELAVIPEMAPHAVRNVGDTTARCLGFFSKPQVISTFDQPVMPFGQRAPGLRDSEA